MVKFVSVGELSALADGSGAALVNRSGSLMQRAVDGRIGPVAADIIASDPTIIAGAEDAIDDAIAGRDLVETTDARLPSLSKEESDLIVTVTDSYGRRTWLEARDSDGGPSTHTESMLRERLGVELVSVPGYLAAFTDSDGRMTDLAVRESDGQFADFVIDRLRMRLSQSSGGWGQRYADIAYDPHTPVLPIKVDMTAMTGWGSSTMLGLNPQMSSMAAGYNMTYFNGGAGGELIEHHAARMNAIPAILSFPGGVIPASGSVVVSSPNMTPRSRLRAYTGHVAGVRGTLSSTDSAVTFTRTTAGAAVTVQSEVLFQSDEGIQHRNDLVIINAGKNNLMAGAAHNDPVSVAERTLAMFDYQAAHQKRVLVLGQFVNTDTPAVSAARDRIYAADGLLKDALGSLFFDMHEWIVSPDVWDEVGITPTAEDLSQQALGNKPPSLSEDVGHMNSPGYVAYTQQIETRLTSLGWL